MRDLVVARGLEHLMKPDVRRVERLI